MSRGTREGGLSAAEVAERVAAGQVNTAATRPSRSLADILRANLLTRFNAILGGLLVVVAFVGPPQDGLFGVVLVVNAAIGIVQELRAKRALDHLAILTAPVAHVLRDGVVADLGTGGVVLGDLLQLRPGDQVPADGLLRGDGAVQVDESLLTGEAEAVSRRRGEEVLSGSIVVSGTGLLEVTRVGPDAYAQRLQLEARRFAAAISELQTATNRVLRVISWLLVPVGALLATSQLLRAKATSADALRGTVAGVGAMVPEGLVLLTTLAFALGALRLANRRVLVQSLPSIEGLARVDVVCIDKTGTLTLPGMRLEQVVPLALGNTPAAGAEDEARAALGALAASDPAPNATMQAIAAACPAPAGWRRVASVPFSSARPWSAAAFDGLASWFLGAPSVLVGIGPPGGDGKARLGGQLAGLAGAGKRVLVLARSTSPLAEGALPADLEARAAVVLEEHLRPDAAEIVGYLLAQGVTVKVLSGDDPRTVGAVAERVGLPAGQAVDATDLPEDPAALVAALASTTVLGRVRPDQKRAIVAALQAEGHTVAMTGDGVNDVPALKQADVGMAMGSGSQASRAIASIVLLDGDFAAVPRILDEGRRVIANIERVASLFLTKTVYAGLLALAAGILAVPYPFYPRQLTVVSSLTIGIPAFLLALAPSAPRAQPHFLTRVLRFSVPAGIGVAIAVLASYGLARFDEHAPTGAARMTAATALFATAVFVLVLVARPLNAARGALVALMAGAGVLAAVVPLSRRIFDLSVPSWPLLATVGVVLAGILPLLWVLLDPRRRARPRGAGGSPHPPGRGGGGGRRGGRRAGARAP